MVRIFKLVLMMTGDTSVELNVVAMRIALPPAALSVVGQLSSVKKTNSVMKSLGV